MKGLRARVFPVVLLAALAPVVAVSLWARTTILERTQAQYARQLEATVAAAKRRVEDRAEQDRRAVERLCERDFVIDRLLLDLAAERFGPSRQDELVQLLPPLMRSLSLDALALLDARPEAEARVLASAHYPGRAGGLAPELLEAGRNADEHPFVEALRIREDGEGRSLETVLTSCTAARGDIRVVVLGGRFLDARYTRDLASDADNVTVVLTGPGGEVPPEVPSGGGARDVHVFETAEGEPAARLVAVIDDSALEAQLAELDRGFLVGGGVALGLALVFGFGLALYLSRPLRQLEAAADRVAAGDLESTLGVRSGGEVGAALSAFNRMTAELRSTREKLLRAERIAAWRDIARRIAHEIKNPLSPIQVSIETMRKTYRKKHPDFDEIFEESTLTILEEVERLKHIVTEFSRFARMPRPRPEELDLREVVSHVAGLHQADEVHVETEAPDAVPTIRADREQVTQVLVNLVQNAADAARAANATGEGRVVVHLEETEDGTEVVVEDNGPGIPVEDRTRIFEPYFTTKSSGTGLGLAIVHRIVGDHGGSIEVRDASLGGAAFAVRLTRRGPPIEADGSMTDAAVPLVQKRGGSGR